jgi:N12 class adenine-specific DNA methylase
LITCTLYDKPVGKIIGELGDSVYSDPIRGVVMADEYLSGDVKTKLEEAQAVAKNDPEFKRNVDALKKVIPKDKLPSEIHATLGANFIPSTIYDQFTQEITGLKRVVLLRESNGPMAEVFMMVVQIQL